jgi:hypothetical protein
LEAVATIENMPHKYQLHLKNFESNEKNSVSGEFSDEEWEILGLFLQYSNELSKARFLHCDEQGRFRIDFEADKGLLETTSTVPNIEETASFLLLLRPLILQKDEPANFHSIRNLLCRKLDHPHFRNLLEQYRQLYSGKIDQGIFRLEINGVLINSDSALIDWLYSYVYHRDLDRRKVYENLHRMLPPGVFDVIFLGLLLDKASAIFELAELVRVVMNKQKGLEFNIRNDIRNR